MNVIIETKREKQPVNVATLPAGWTIRRLNAGLRAHLRARRIRSGEIIGELAHVGASSLEVGEVFG